MEIEKIAGLTVKQSAFLMEYARTDNLSQACRVAGINRTTGYNYLKNDDFQYELGLDPKLVHKPALKDRGNLILVYALWKSKNGGFGFEVMSKEDVDDHARRFSQSFGSSYSPWKTNYEEMAKKTVIKKCLKYAPLKTDFVMQMNNDESIKSEINVDMSEVVNEQEDPNIIDQEYKEVENEQSEQ